jgi:hypothetical protein
MQRATAPLSRTEAADVALDRNWPERALEIALDLPDGRHRDWIIGEAMAAMNQGGPLEAARPPGTSN